MTKPAFSPTQITTIRPLGDNIVVCDMIFDERFTRNGIVLLNDDMKSSGIRPRWAKVYAIGPDQTDVAIGQYICVEHGRWTRGIKITDATGDKTLHRVDKNAILLVSDEPVEDMTMSDKV